MAGNAIVAIWGSTMLGAMLLAGLVSLWKNRDYSVWMAWSFLLPPALFILLLLPRHKGARPRRRTLDEEDRQTDHA